MSGFVSKCQVIFFQWLWMSLNKFLFHWTIDHITKKERLLSFSRLRHPLGNAGNACDCQASAACCKVVAPWSSFSITSQMLRLCHTHLFFCSWAETHRCHFLSIMKLKLESWWERLNVLCFLSLKKSIIVRLNWKKERCVEKKTIMASTSAEA